MEQLQDLSVHDIITSVNCAQFKFNNGNGNIFKMMHLNVLYTSPHNGLSLHLYSVASTEGGVEQNRADL